MLLLTRNHILPLFATNVYQIFKIQGQAISAIDNGVTYQCKEIELCQLRQVYLASGIMPVTQILFEESL